ncbi:hypothetical protein F5Y14DRAFT_346465 [Nemania sp. NC0429]|nr:hypothetical protein F5Y14DRAFT_346465 [Nemania sp. NC0429]
MGMGFTGGFFFLFFSSFDLVRSGRFGLVRVGEDRIGLDRIGYVRICQVRSGQVRSGLTRFGSDGPRVTFTFIYTYLLYLLL